MPSAAVVTRVAVVGGGIVGLAAARAVQRARPGAEVVVFEKETAVGLHQTGRNSGVVHAGLYYEPGSLKARLCRRGVELTRAYCSERGLPYEECGKVVVATRPDELTRLAELHERAEANGVPGVALLSEHDLRAIEPHAAGIAALHSPHTAITDFGAIARRLAHEVEDAGGTVRLGARVARVRGEGARPVVELAGGEEHAADRVLVCAGLEADRLARASGRSAAPAIVPFRGEYWALREDRRHLVRGLIYPVPDPALPFLGVHLSRMADGAVLVGPNAVLALAREGYGRWTLDRRDALETLRWPGTRRLVRRHWRAGAAELARSASRRAFARAARRYVPELRAGDLLPAPAGVRAQAVDRDGSLVDDFRIDAEPGVVWVRNAPSPAATSAPAIAEELVERLRL